MNMVLMRDLKKDIRDIFEGEIKFDEPMSLHTSLKIGGPVEIMVFPDDPVSLKNVMVAAVREGIPAFIFGAGTNLLVEDDGINGIAISLKKFRSIEFTKETNDKNAVLYAGSGVPLAMLVSFAKKNGFSGIEALAGIPGYLGGAICMNAGSFGTEIKDVIVAVAIMNKHGEIMILNKDEIDFSYRGSNLPESAVILGANIILKKESPGEVKKRTESFLKKKKTSQPLGDLSAGCVFKNPPGHAAGKLIDDAGCKGMRMGDVEVSKMHANYFINRGSATFREFIKLMETVKGKVKEFSGVELEEEIKIIRG
jgi:UDP-N-acetylmuramate dehydrogenase